MSSTPQTNGAPPVSAIDADRLRAATHPNERSWIWLALVALVPLLLVVAIYSALSLFTLPLLFVATVFVTGRITEARLRGAAVEVSTYNFAEIEADISYVCHRLGYEKPVRAFVYPEGEVNALLWRVFGRRYLSFTSEMVNSFTADERRFVVGYFVGALRSRHLRFHEASALLESVEKLKLLNVLVLPYLRATVLTGDRFGLMAIDNQQAALSVLRKLMVGSELAATLSDEGLLLQAQQLRTTIFRWLATLFSPHPHLSDRYIELSTFAALERSPAAAQPAAPPPPPPRARVAPRPPQPRERVVPRPPPPPAKGQAHL